MGLHDGKDPHVRYGGDDAIHQNVSEAAEEVRQESAYMTNGLTASGDRS